jgi:hypothetical protein
MDWNRAAGNGAAKNADALRNTGNPPSVSLTGACTMALLSAIGQIKPVDGYVAAYPKMSCDSLCCRVAWMARSVASRGWIECFDKQADAVCEWQRFAHFRYPMMQHPRTLL